MKQGSSEWRMARVGRLTGSELQKVITGGKTAETYMTDLIGETLTQQPADEISSKYLDWGNTYEPAARALYAWQYADDPERSEVTQVGFAIHPEYDRVGCSPDSLVGKAGILEIKCPYTPKNHLRTLMTGKVPIEYVAQVQGNLWITEREWCDFVSYHPLFPDNMQLSVVTVGRNEEYIDSLERKVRAFLKDLERKLVDLKERCNDER